MGTAAASSNETLAGFSASASSDAAAYSANAPRHQPNTSSPGRSRVTPAPTASTCPATSTPRTGFFGLRSPYNGAGRAMYGRPLMIAQSPGLTAAARTRTNTSWSPIAGLSISLSSRTSPEPYLSWTIAFIVSAVTAGVGSVGGSSVVLCMGLSECRWLTLSIEGYELTAKGGYRSLSRPTYACSLRLYR